MIAYLNKLVDILSKTQIRSALILFIYMIFGMALETLGVGAILPLLVIFSEPNFIANHPEWSPLISFLGDPEEIELIKYSLAFIFIIYLLKSVFLTLLIFKQNKFIYGLQESLSLSFFSRYLRQPYSFHLTRNSSELIRNSLSEANQFSGAVGNVMLVTTEALVLVGIIMLLLIIEPLGTLAVAALMGLLGSTFLYFTKGKSEKYGEERMHHDGKRIQHLQQGLSGIKEVKLFGREINFMNLYSNHNSKSAINSRKQAIIVSLPRLYVELIAVSGLVGLVLVYILEERTMQSLVPLLGLFAIAAFRIMPSINRIVSCLQSLRFTLPILHTLHDEINILRLNAIEISPSKKEMIFKKSIEAKDIKFSYDNSNQVTLKDINFRIELGSCVGFIGESGAGKSTLLDIILGLIKPSSGFISVDETNIYDDLRSWQNKIGYVPQEIYLTDDTLRRNIAFGLNDSEIDDKKIDQALEYAQLKDFIYSLEAGLDAKVGERGVRLSGGQRQRIGMARALYNDPSILVLDEATSSLDAKTEREVMAAVKELKNNKTIIIVAHRTSTMSDCNYIYRLNEGVLSEKISYKNLLENE